MPKKVGPKRVKKIRDRYSKKYGGATDMAMESAQRKIKKKRAKRRK